MIQFVKISSSEFKTTYKFSGTERGILTLYHDNSYEVDIDIDDDFRIELEKAIITLLTKENYPDKAIFKTN